MQLTEIAHLKIGDEVVHRYTKDDYKIAVVTSINFSGEYTTIDEYHWVPGVSTKLNNYYPYLYTVTPETLALVAETKKRKLIKMVTS